MYICVVTQKAKNSNSQELPYNSYLGTNPEKLATMAEDQAIACRRQNPTMEYRVLVAKVTHQVKPPDHKVELVEFAE